MEISTDPPTAEGNWRWLVTDSVHGEGAASFPSFQEVEINSSITSRPYSAIQIILFRIQQAYRTKLAQMYKSFHIKRMKNQKNVVVLSILLRV
jgi:hypothetical protein